MKRYKMIGGPLDGRDACSRDFDRGFQSTVDAKYDRPPGQFVAHHGMYYAFNRADRFTRLPTMVWLHESLLRSDVI